MFPKKHSPDGRFIVGASGCLFCKNGHPLSGDNLIPNIKARRCKICHNAYQKARKAKLRLLQGAKPMAKGNTCRKGHQMIEFKDGRRRCRECPRARSIKYSRANGVKPFVRRTVDEKKKQRVKHQQTRESRKKGQFVEYVDPIILYKRDNGICGICHKPVYMNAFEVDHIIPLARGGEHSYKNTCISHPTCNRKKWAKMPSENLTHSSI
jgi:5-methylcytosine-specific restriction endonuclease McrA